MRTLIIGSLFFLSSVLPGNAQTQCSYLFVDVYEDPGTYTGQCQNGRAHGVGTVDYDNGDRYEGEFQHGKRHGQGTLDWVSGSRYEGEFQHGKRHGQGTFFYAIVGFRYEGAWQHGKKHGQGTLFFKRGNRYEGEWQHGKPTNGTEYLSSGETCEYKNGQKMC